MTDILDVPYGKAELVKKLEQVICPEDGSESLDPVTTFEMKNPHGMLGLDTVLLYHPKLDNKHYWVVVLVINGSLLQENYTVFDDAPPAFEFFNHAVAALKAYY
ncbi:hypothetical protein IAJ44_004334 [Salmonella enterica]|nr:hypothetical protein [Salmonella enterica]